VLSLVSSAPSWEEHLKDDLFLCQVEHKTLTQSINQHSATN